MCKIRGGEIKSERKVTDRLDKQQVDAEQRSRL